MNNVKKLLLGLMTAGLFACNNGDQQHTGDNESDSLSSNPFEKLMIRQVDSAAIPAGIKFKGSLYQAWEWKDALGDNLLIASQTPITETTNADDETGAAASLHAFHYTKDGDTYKLLWQLNDGVKDCPVDLTCTYLANSIHITDLDNNGVAETTLQYKTACRGDVSPAYMKVIMHQDTVKYGLRGNMWVKQNTADRFTLSADSLNLEKLPKPKDEYARLVQMDGRYESEKDFLKAPESFLLFAKEQWLKHVIETFE